MANAILTDGAYHLDPAIDMWQFGMFVVGMLGGDPPEAHEALRRSAAWNEAIDIVDAHQGIDLLDLPVWASLQYLQDLGASEVDYASQVSDMPLCMCLDMPAGL